MPKRVKIFSVTFVILVIAAAGGAFAFGSTGSGGAHALATTTTTVLSADAPESLSPPATPPVSAATADVAKVQQQLSDLGYWVGPVDGKVGQTTQQALLAFQKLQNLPRSGAIDDATLTAMTTAARPTAASKAGDVIEVDKRHQVIFFVKDGQMQWVFNTSTGTESSYTTNGIKGFAHTPTGTFRTLRVVNKVDPGPLGPLYRPRYFTNTGIAIHGAGSIPATPASHGCARVSNAAIDFIWANNMMPIGGTVWVYDDPATTPLGTPPAPAPATTATTPAPTTTTTAPPTTTVPPTTAPPTTVDLTTTSTTA